MSQKPDGQIIQPPTFLMPHTRYFMPLRILSNVFVVLTGAYGLNLTLFLTLRLLVGEQWSVIGLFNSIAHLMLIPALLLLPLCLLLRRWRLALTQLPAALMFVLSYGILFLPRPVEAIPNSTAISVMTFNLHGEEQFAEPLAALIRESGVDIIALQEVSPTVGVLLEDMADVYPHQALHPNEEPTRGLALLSRYPLLEDEYWRTAAVPQSMGHQRVEIDVDGVRFTVYNTHPVHPAMTGRLFDPIPRALEITELLARIGEENRAAVMMGDFNLTDLSEDYARIAARYGDTYREVGWGMGFTFPDFSQPQALPRFLSNTTALPPFVRLDYIFHNDAVQALEARVWPTSGGSDHRPVFTRLALAQ